MWKINFYRRYAVFQTTSELPMIDDYDIKVGAPPILHNESIHELNIDLKCTIECGEKNKKMGNHIIAVVEKSQSEREVHTDPKFFALLLLSFIST